MTLVQRRVGLILYDRTDLLDIAGPAEVFHAAGLHLIRTGAATSHAYCLDWLSVNGGLVRTDHGLGLDTTPMDDRAATDYDTIIVSGGYLNALDCDEALIAWLRQTGATVRRVGSVCTGAFLLARAGLLEARAATTHWMDCEALRLAYPAVEVRSDAIFVEDNGVWTSAGITAGTDMALAMVEQDHGHELAMAVARYLVVFLKRQGGQSQFSTMLRAQVIEGPLGPLLHWIADHPAADLSGEALAERANMSLRNFFRTFKEVTAATPADWVLAVRMEAAKRLIEQTSQPFDQVARKAGFLNYERMRRSFGRLMGVTPAAYRARFANPSPTRGKSRLR